MVKVGDTWKDLTVYINLREQNLRTAERTVIDSCIPKARQKALAKVKGRLAELKVLKKVINGNIRDYSKAEYKLAKENEAKINLDLN